METNLVISICETLRSEEAHAKFSERGDALVTSFGRGRWRLFGRIEF